MPNALLLIVWLMGIVFTITYRYYGIAFLVFLYFIPPLLFKFKNELINNKRIGKKMEIFYGLLRKNNIFFILFYMSCTMTIFSLVGSFYPSYSKEDFQMLVTLNNAGYASLWLILPIFVVSRILDKSIIKLSGFIFGNHGLFDPITGEDNVSLRSRTFWKLIDNLQDEKIKSIATSIGKEYGELILKKYSSIKTLENLVHKWVETDSKAGLINKIESSGSDTTRLLLITNSFAKQYCKEHSPSKNVCTFMECYVSGIISAFYAAQGSSADIKLVEHNCKNCTTSNVCMVNINNS